jgi:hypothetical protein
MDELRALPYLVESEGTPAFLFVAFSDGKPVSTFPENALPQVNSPI